jgi:tetratricopeptide (TPR) repeat protein
VTGPGELVEHGIQAYLQGRVDEARTLFEHVLTEDPSNGTARSYLILIGGAFGAPAQPPQSPETARPPPQPPRRPAPRAARPTSPPAAEPREDFAPSPWDEGPAAKATIVLEPDGGLDLDAVAEKSDIRALVPEQRGSAPDPGRHGVRQDVETWLRGARELFALGDFSGSLEMIEKILQVDPRHAEARGYLEQNEATLVEMYESKLGPRSGVPRLAIQPEEILWLNLDHRAGFLLAQIDGTVDFDDLFALSGLPRLDTARILATLIHDGVIAA